MAKENNLKDFLTDVADAIREKDGSTEAINPQDFSSRIRAMKDEISMVVSEEAEEKLVNFYDVRGNRVYSYTQDEFVALAGVLPDVEDVEGLTSVGWNRNYQDIQSSIDKGKSLIEVGACYEADYTTLVIAHNDPMRLTMALRFLADSGCIFEVDFGDGSAIESFAGNGENTVKEVNHTYTKKSAKGVWEIKISATQEYKLASRFLNSNNSSIKAASPRLKRAWLDKRITVIKDDTFNGCSNLESIVISPSTNFIGSEAFYECRNLKHITLGNLDSTLNIGYSAFLSSGLEHLSFNKDICFDGNEIFYDCQRLRSVSFPERIWATDVNGIFSRCFSLNKVSMEDMGIFYTDYDFPLTTWFAQCTSLAHIKLINPITTLDLFAFEDCPSLLTIDMRDFNEPPTLINDRLPSYWGTNASIIVQDHEIQAFYDAWGSEWGIMLVSASTFESYFETTNEE